MKYKISILYILISIFIAATNVTAKDVSNEITVSNSGVILGCITRLQIYAEESKNMMEMPDPNFQKVMVRNALLISIPYLENIRNAAWSVFPANQDWDAFYSQQIELVNLHYKTNNIFFDTMSCVQDLRLYGVMYPRFTDEIPPEQMEILEKLMQQ